MKRELLSRAYLVLFLLSLAALILIGKTAWVSQVEGREWRHQGDSTKLKIVDILPDRGNIYSADGFMLATSVPLFDLHMDFASEAMTQSIFKNNVDSLAICLAAHVFTKNTKKQVYDRLLKARKGRQRYFLIKKNATYEQYQKIKKFPLIGLGKYQGGLVVEQHSRRLKPFKSLAHRTIGLSRKNAQSIGLEASFDEYLKGKEGKRLMQKVGNKVWVPMNDLSEIQPEKGMDIVTTLDMRIQDIAQNSIRKSLEKHAAEYGVAVVMEVKTGKIKALVNLDRQKDGSYWESYNHAVGDAVEPGSTFKLASMMALLEDFQIDITDSINLHGGRYNFGSHTMRDAELHNTHRTTLKHAFAISSNIGVAKLVDRYYSKDGKSQRYIDRLRSFNLDQKTGIEIVGEGTPHFKDAYTDGWSRTTTLPWMSHGYELTITPLQLLTFYNAVANNGHSVKPYLVDRVRYKGKVHQQFEPMTIKRNIASAATIRTARELLEAVVTDGTGRKLQRPHYTFAGKSGTSKLEYWKGDDKYLSSFIGYFPAEEPVYSCIVMIKNPRENGYYGSRVAAPVFSEIADFCIATDTQMMQPAFAVNSFAPPVFQSGLAHDLTAAMDYLELPYTHEATSEYAVLMPSDSLCIMKNRLVRDKLVPNVAGMGLRDALFILENIGLEVKINGSGKVTQQSLEAGTPLVDKKILLSLG